ncbi:osmoprotectant NAGGN system M42 family peptidase [Seongchinamella unica]|uniref:Osmoprotectant NAGGN system M42 family peptidase n=1 Tax=Seongchinamella unica TaxID=2547392 RepID=A0A4R5LQL5_9GAMM|nr:osmoprotectant NAGGN system M42 family peptidase [Seongchinamella unica]TDG12821.1 osmoprotectant NAGGN system M42 family peptidase [Seongchinamella unica]
MRALKINQDYLRETLEQALAIPSPTGMTNEIVHFCCDQLKQLGIEFELTRRGAIRATLPGRRKSPDRAIVAHLDTLGAMVTHLRDNGRPAVAPVGTWPARAAEGARVTLYADHGKQFRGTLLPLKASGHVYNEEVDQQPAHWDNLELRLDEVVASGDDVAALGIQPGDFVAVDPQTELLDNGFWFSRFLDDKAGVAALLAAARAIVEEDAELPMDVHLLFTITEETGAGASHVLHGDVAELIAVDNGTIAPDQNTSEYGATIAMQDSSGPFDYYLSRRLSALCDSFGIEHSRDVFRHYRSDAAAALEAGNDIRTALVCFALDSSHGYERTHRDSVTAVASLLTLYMQTDAMFERDADAIGPLQDFPEAQGDWEDSAVEEAVAEGG